MVFPPPSPDDAPGPRERPWLVRLSGILGLVRRGIIVLVDRARPERLGELVRALSPAHPDLEVHTDVVRLARAEKGALVILVPDAAQADWMNQERPIFAHRELRVILFSDAETTIALMRRAPDFFSWISHRLECPEGPPLAAVRGIQAALRTRAVGVAWSGGDLEATFHAALPGRPLVEASAALRYERMVEAAKPAGRGWVAWTDADGPFRLRRVRWASAEAGRRGKTIVIAPAIEAKGFAPVHGRLLAVAEARERLEQAGAKHPGRLAALVELEPEAVDAVAAVLRASVDEAQVEEAARVAEDPGVAVGRMAEARGLDVGEPLRVRMNGARRPPEEAVEGLLRRKAPWVEVAKASLEGGDPRASVLWARRTLEEAPGEAEALYVVGTALARNGEYAEAEDRLRGAETQYAAKPDQAPLLSATLRELAVLAHLQKHDDKAEMLARESLQLAKRHHGREHEEYARSLGVLGVSLVFQEHYEEAENVLKRAARTLASVCGPGSAAYADAAGSLALSVSASTSPAEALTMLEATLEETTIDAEHPSYADLLLALGGVLFLVKRYAEADAAVTRAIAIWEKVSGDAHPALADALFVLAGIWSAQGRYADAEILFRRRASILEDTFGSDDPVYAKALSDLGNSLIAEGNLDEALAVLLWALVILEKEARDPDATLKYTLLGIATALAQAGSPKDAEGFVRRAIESARQSGSSKNEPLARALEMLASLQANRGDPKAAATAREALDVVRSLGPDHPMSEEMTPRLRRIASPKSPAG
jgi:tetratricopeptide (TPR) repeat protein